MYFDKELERVLTSPLFPFLEQIYYNIRKSKNRSTMKIYFKSITKQLKTLNSRPLIQNKCKLALFYIMTKMDENPSNLHYLDVLQIKLSYTNTPELIEIIGSDKRSFLDTINALTDLGFIIKVKGSLFLANPYYFDVLTKDHWSELRLNISQKEMFKQASLVAPQPPLIPEP